MRPLEVVIAESASGLLESRIFGTTDPAAMAAQWNDVAEGVGSAIAGAHWYIGSVSAVAGVVLHDGREVVLRAYQPSVVVAFLEGVIRVQSHAANHGFPAAVPLSAPVRTAWGLGRVESVLPDPGSRRPSFSSMAVSATGLARITALAAEVEAPELELHPMAMGADLFPEPHSPLFDFAATQEGAAWIDDIAVAAKAVVGQDDAAVVSHGDWSARNVRFDADHLLAVYDWESLEHAPESMAVGVAAATWNALGDGLDPMAPPPDAISRYVELYDRARGRPLSPEQKRAALAMATYSLAYTARCEHSRQPGIRSGRATSRLHADGATLVSMFQ